MAERVQKGQIALFRAPRIILTHVIFFIAHSRESFRVRRIALLVCSFSVTNNLAQESSPARTTSKKRAKPLRILILGGTGFTGPFQVRYALARGHKVTVFNRGKTHPGELPEGVEQLIGDRNGKLDALKGRKWDVVIDNPTIAAGLGARCRRRSSRATSITTSSSPPFPFTPTTASRTWMKRRRSRNTKAPMR